MKLDKTTKFADSPVYPPLEKFLTELYLKVPSLSFEAKSTDNWLRDMEGKDIAYINNVLVFNGVEQVGKVQVEYRTHRGSSGRVHVYEIQSPRIRKSIGRKEVKETAKYSEALKLSVKVFSVTKTPQERGKDIWTQAEAELNNISYSARRSAERIAEEFAMDMAVYLMQAMKGDSPPIPSAVHSKLTKPDTEKHFTTHSIVSAVQGRFELRDGVVVIEERDGSMTEVTHTGTEFITRKLLSSYDLPEVMQPKIGMLKMLKEKQAAESIGVRFVVNEYNWFFLCNGEIITAS